MKKQLIIVLMILTLASGLLISGCGPSSPAATTSPPPPVSTVPPTSSQNTTSPTTTPPPPVAAIPPPATTTTPPAATATEGSGLGQTAPHFQLLDREGQTVSLSSFRGRPVLLNFWATWCGPCRFEMPFLQQVYNDWTARQSSLVMLTIDYKESPDKIDTFMTSLNLSLPVLLDTDGSVAKKYNITAIPTTFFIDKGGIIQVKMVGAFTNVQQIESYLSKIAP